jgi:hypothetical protein
MNLRQMGKGCAARWTRPAWYGALVVTVAASLIFAAGASAATVRVALGGSMTVTADPSIGEPAVGVSLSGVAGDLVYTGIGSSTGTVTVTMPSAPPFANATGPGASLTVFHGDVSQGCVRVQGNQAVVIGHLPASEQFDIPFGHMEWVGAFLEDNGVATGSPVDRARGVFFRTQSGANACDPSNAGVWANFPGVLRALDAGGTDFGYTDRLDSHPGNPDTDVSVVDPSGLSVSITDAPDPDGVSVAVGSGSGFAELNSCGQQVNVDAASTVVLTCASLIARVVTGSAEVVLGDGLTTVSLPVGGEVEITDAGNGSFTVENLGATEIVVTIGNVETTIDPGDPPFDGWVSSSAQLEQVEADLEALAAGASAKAQDKLEDAVAKVEAALAKLAASPPDRQGAAGELEGAAGDLEAAVKQGLIATSVGTGLLTEIAEAARLLAQSAIADAEVRGGSADKIAEAQKMLASADSRLASGRFTNAVGKYKDTISTAEGA